MKNIFLLILLVSTSVCNAQDWFTSFDVAKRLALVQNKMLFVMWEESTEYPYPVIINTDDGAQVLVDLFEDDRVNEFIWEHFIPVKLSESMYAELSYQNKKTRGAIYYNKLIDDSFKIMDVNSNILNVSPLAKEYEFLQQSVHYENLSLIIGKYSLNTSFLRQELANYLKQAGFNTAFSLGLKYLDYAIFSNKDVRPEIIKLGNIYFNEALVHLEQSDLIAKEVFLQKHELLKIKEYLILNNPNKARRVLKRIEVSEIHKTNQPLFSFLNYTTFKLLKDEEKGTLWKDKLSKVNLKRAELILKNNIK